MRRRFVARDGRAAEIEEPREFAGRERVEEAVLFDPLMGLTFNEPATQVKAFEALAIGRDL